nr:hypothetical protein [Comamonas testosteroni]
MPDAVRDAEKLLRAEAARLDRLYGMNKWYGFCAEKASCLEHLRVADALAAPPAAAAPVVTTIPDAAYCALQYVEQALAAIANREELVESTIERVDTIGKASKRAKAALTRLQAVAHHFNALEESPAAAAPAVLSEPDAAIREVIALVNQAVRIGQEAARHDFYIRPTDCVKSLKRLDSAMLTIETKMRALLTEVSAPTQISPEWEKVRRGLTMVMLGLAGRPDCSESAIEAALDAVTEPGMPLAGLRALAGVSAPAAQAVPVKPQPITLTVNQLRQAIEFGTGDFTPDTTDELETQLSICWGSLEDDDGNVTECMRCWLFEYPEEGAIPLDEQPTERDLASLATPPAQADARDAQLLAFAVSEIRRGEMTDSELLDAMEQKGIAVVPEYEGPWDAEIYNDEGKPNHYGSGSTPREAIRLNHKGARTVFAVGAVGDGQRFAALVNKHGARVLLVEPHHSAAATGVENCGHVHAAPPCWAAWAAMAARIS